MKNPLELYEQFEPCFSLIKTGYNLFDSYITKKHKERTTLFHRQILDGDASEEKIEYETEYIKANPHDYYTLLKYVNDDDEKEKVSIYSNIYNYIRNNQNIPSIEKYKLIQIAKGLSYSSIQLIPMIYIHKNYLVKNKTLDEYLKEIISNENLIFEINQLTQYGLLKNIQLGQQVLGNGLNLTITKNIDFIAKSFFKEEDILPQIYDMPIWIRSTGILADLSENTNFEYIQGLLDRKKIKSSLNSNILQFREEFFYNPKDIFICILNEKIIPQESIDILKKWAKRYKILKICLEDTILDQLHEIDGELIHIEKGKKEDEEKFLSNILIGPLDLF